MRFALRHPPSEISHTFPTGWEHALWVRKYPSSGITFAAVLPPTSSFLLLDSGPRRGIGAREDKSPERAFGSAKPQISLTLFTPWNYICTTWAPCVSCKGNWSWVNACSFGGRVGRGERWEYTIADLNYRR